MVVSINLKRDRLDIIDRFKQTIQRTPEIMNAYYVAGDADFVLTISMRDLAEYEEFSRRFLYESSEIRGSNTMIVLDRTKASLALPIDE
ncbi:Lrp/AsnC ligand binding domain-containing protein [Ensifer aridi]|uniref:Lrp/AsnC ligand binding domain-containing protein n=1 Tax=Ensifer aridi TaxID=1708715 RepID=UPI001FCD41B6|nr:Lrp/AsnC ligand binding domain-containing protein [Ensifer aridi]